MMAVGADRLKGFDSTRASYFVEHFGNELCRVRLRHWEGQANIRMLWEELSKYQTEDGGFARGVDPDYRGQISSIHSTIEAMRICWQHEVYEAPGLDKMCDFLRSTMLEDGTWRESARVLSTPECPRWYMPARYRLYETCCVAGYGLDLGLSEMWSGAVKYVRSIWPSMPPATSMLPYMSVLLLLGRSYGESNRTILFDTFDALKTFFRRKRADALDCGYLAHVLFDVDFPESSELLIKIAEVFETSQRASDGGVETAYGEHLRPLATLLGIIAMSKIYTKRIVACGRGY